MTALSIRHMNFTLREMELARWAQEAADFAAQPAPTEPVYYWHIERKAKRGKDKWLFVTELWETETRANEILTQHYPSDHRLRKILRISPSETPDVKE